MRILSDHPGGNIRLLGTDLRPDGADVYLEPELCGHSLWWFYWNFRVEDAPPLPVTFRFLNGEPVGSRGPATATDGRSWRYEPAAFVDHATFRFAFTGERIRYFSFCLPYTGADFEAFWARLAPTGRVTRSLLATSEGGRPIPLLTLGEGARNVFLCARSHACEASGSYVLEGFLSEVLDDPALLSGFRFHVAPMLDPDGVERGEQGKGRLPHDHNRDYLPAPRYAAIRAWIACAKAAAPFAFLDFHSPRAFGGQADHPHIHLSEGLGGEPDLQARFVDALRARSALLPEDAIRFDGVAVRARGAEADALACIGDGFFCRTLRAPLSVTLETPYAGALAAPYTPEALRAFGRTVARAFAETV